GRVGRPRGRGQRAAHRGGEGEQVGILQAELQRAVAAHREARDRAPLARRDGAEASVNVGYQLLYKVALVFLVRHRRAVRVPGVVAFGDDDDEGVAGGVVREVRAVGDPITC